MNISTVKWAYIAGLFEGEGSVRHVNRAIQIEISMTNREPLDIVANALGGNVRGPFDRKEANWNPIYRLCIAKKSVVDEFYANTLMWLSPKKINQFELAYERYRAVKTAVKSGE